MNTKNVKAFNTMNTELALLKFIGHYIEHDPDDNGQPYLPDEILWRQKEQFSDGVGYNWIDGLKEFIESQITDTEFEKSVKDNSKYTDDKPKNKEELYYRRIFDRLFPGREKIVPRWIPKTEWDGVGYDPSGRAQNIHSSSKC